MTQLIFEKKEVIMNKYLTISASTMLLFAGLFLITGCSSSDDAPVSATPTPTPTVPANAVEITAANAEATVAASVATASTFEDGIAAALAVETTPVIGLSGALDLVLPLIKDRLNNSGIDPVYGVAYNESGACFESGTWSASGDEVFGETSSSDTFTATFVNCDDGFGFIIDGTLTGTVTEDYTMPYGYTLAVTGNLSLIVTGDSTVKISFTGIDFQKSGEMLDGTYTTAKSSFAIDFIVNGTSSGGFLSELKAAIVESTGFGSCPESGHIFITGANNTTAEGIYNGDDTMTIKANGEVVEPSTVCYY